MPVEATTYVYQGEVARWKVEDDQYNNHWRNITQSGSVELLCLSSGGSSYSTVMMRRTCDDNYCPGHTPWGADQDGNTGHIMFSPVGGRCGVSAYPGSNYEKDSPIYVTGAGCGRRLEQPELAPELATATATDPATDPAPDPTPDPAPDPAPAPRLRPSLVRACAQVTIVAGSQHTTI